MPGVATGPGHRGRRGGRDPCGEFARVGGIRLDERTAALAPRRTRASTRRSWAARTELERLRRRSRRSATACRPSMAVVGEPGSARRGWRASWRGSDGAARRCWVGPLRRPRRGRHLPRRCWKRSGGRISAAVLDGGEDAQLVARRIAALAGARRPRRSASPSGPYADCSRHWRGVGPVVLLLDDVHWAEPALLDLIDYLDARVDSPLLVLCLARPECRAAGWASGLGARAAARRGYAGDRETAAPWSTRSPRADRRVWPRATRFPAEQLAVRGAADGGRGTAADARSRARRTTRSSRPRRASLPPAGRRGRPRVLARGASPRSPHPTSRQGSPRSRPPGSSTRPPPAARATTATASTTSSSAMPPTEASTKDAARRPAPTCRHLDRPRRPTARQPRRLPPRADRALRQVGLRWTSLPPSPASGLAAPGCGSGSQQTSRPPSACSAATGPVPSSGMRADFLWERAIALRLSDRLRVQGGARRGCERGSALSVQKSDPARAWRPRPRLRLLMEIRPWRRDGAAFEAALDALRQERDDRGTGRAELLSCSVHWFASITWQRTRAPAGAQRHALRLQASRLSRSSTCRPRLCTTARHRSTWPPRRASCSSTRLRIVGLRLASPPCSAACAGSQETWRRLAHCSNTPGQLYEDTGRRARPADGLDAAWMNVELCR